MKFNLNIKTNNIGPGPVVFLSSEIETLSCALEEREMGVSSLGLS